MKKIVGYTLAKGNADQLDRVLSLSDAVRKLIDSGWQPHGSAITIDRGRLAQPMVLYRTEE